jgi:hypothetical protein
MLFFDWLQALIVESSTLDKKIYRFLFFFSLSKLHKDKESKVQKL